ncbi:MAG: RNA methyltransferase [Crocinitomicaceae bacterium]|nr:RNA methyltransferase [Crocinitomicaceae bacterium]MDG1776838.1 RNA methyltransferase [Crocinitomicaceae bacterium]
MKTVNEKGYCAIGVFRGKTSHNLGTLWRSAYILGAAYIFTVEGRYKKQSSDVVRAWSRIPLFNYKDFDDLLKNIPYDCRLIGVEIDDRAEWLHEFQHPKRAIYLLGAEDTGLPEYVREKCHFIVKLPGNSSLNVGVTGSVVLHDRATKVPTDFPPDHRDG